MAQEDILSVDHKQGRGFNRRKTDVNYVSLNVRLKALEDYVHLELTPMINRNTTMTAEIHAKNDEMYQAFTAAKNAITVIAKIGNGIVWTAELCAKLARPFFWLTMAAGSSWAAFSEDVHKLLNRIFN